MLWFGKSGARSLVAVLVAAGLAGCVTQVDGDGVAASGVEEPTDGPTDEPTDGPTGGPGGSCGDSDVENSGDPLEDAVVGESPDGLAPYPDFTGPMDLDRVLLENFPKEDEAVARDIFTDAGFVAGHQNSWAEGTLGSSESILENATVYEFESAEGVCDVLDWHRSYYRYDRQPGLDFEGAIGSEFTNDEGTLTSVEYLAPKGNRIALSLVIFHGTGDFTDLAAQILDQQYEVT